MLSLQIIIFGISFLVISWAGSLLVRSVTTLSKLFRISEYVIAFLLMSFATSIPELSIGISSALQNVSSISFGDVLGANLINITLVTGLITIISGGLSIESKISKINFWVIFFVAFIPLLMAVDGVISRGDGTILLIAFLFYILRLIQDKEYFKKQHIENGVSQGKKFSGTLKILRHFLAGIFLLIVSAFALIWSAKGITSYFDINILFFGLVFVAIGTTLPELVFGFKASTMKHPSMMLGNSLGSIAFNSAAVVGIVALISPINVVFNAHILTVAGFLFLAFILFNIFAYSKSKISRIEGVMLILLYILFILIQISL